MDCTLSDVKFVLNGKPLKKMLTTTEKKNVDDKKCIHVV